MKSRKRIIITLLVCTCLSALAYFAYMFPFYEFETNDYEASKEKLFSLEYLKTLVPIFIILLIQFI